MLPTKCFSQRNKMKNIYLDALFARAAAVEALTKLKMCRYMA